MYLFSITTQKSNLCYEIKTSSYEIVYLSFRKKGLPENDLYVFLANAANKIEL